MGFSGFSQDTFAFLQELEANNDRAWFEAHRAEYEAHWLKPGLDLAAALAGPVAGLGLVAEPKLNASLRRIHRDTRFSADKRPYQPRLHLILSTGPAHAPGFIKLPGVHLVLSPRGFGHGVGHWAFSPEGLDQLRAAFCEAEQRARFLQLVDAAGTIGAVLDPPDLARVPKGWQANAAWDHLLRRKHVVVRTPEDLGPPDWLFAPQAVDRLVALAAQLAPIARWLVPFA